MRAQRFSIRNHTLSDTIFTRLKISVDLHVSMGHFHSMDELCVISIHISSHTYSILGFLTEAQFFQVASNIDL